VVLIDGVQGGFFLRKKPLKLALPVYSNSETALGEGYDQESCFWAREIALTDATIRARNPAMNPYKVYDREGLFLLGPVNTTRAVATGGNFPEF